MKKILWFFGSLLFDLIATMLLGVVAALLFFGIGYLLGISEVMNLTYVVMVLYLLFCNVFYVSVGFRLLKIRYSGNKYLVLLSNFIFLAYWYGAYKGILILQLIGTADLICLFIPKINQRLVNRLSKIKVVAKEEIYETMKVLKEK